MIYEKSCGAVLYTYSKGERKYVLVQNPDGIYGFPKGHMEGDESEIETAIREIYEEVQVCPQFIDGFQAADRYMLQVDGQPVSKQVIYFLAEFKNQELIMQKEELISVQLVAFNEAMHLLQVESSRRILEEANEFLNRCALLN